MFGDTFWNIAVCILGWVIGLTFADIDLAPPLPVKHRSAWTHGPLVPWAMFYFIDSYWWVWWFAVGFLPAFCLHLLYDMFPKAWHGSAKINFFPVPLTLPAVFSFLFLGGAILFSLSTLSTMLPFNALAWIGGYIDAFLG